MKAAMIFLVLAIAAIAHADEETETCVVDGVTLKKGESKSAEIGECDEITCKGKNKIIRLGCGVFQARPNCTVSDTDYKKPFPECCPKEVC